MSELLPCPFCGGEVRLTYEGEFLRANPATEEWWANCAECGSGCTDSAKNKAEAIKAWNTRNE